jgi:uncharacterized protein (UPF0332 family)
MPLSPARLLEHAERLIAAPGGPPTEEDLRRAVSAVYYAVFHMVVGATADLFSKIVDPTQSIHERIYRKPEHKDINNCWSKSLCKDKGVQVDSHIEKFAGIFNSLYEERLDADYKVTTLITHYGAQSSIKIGREAIEDFLAADEGARNVFLSLIVFPSRSKS